MKKIFCLAMLGALCNISINAMNGKRQLEDAACNRPTKIAAVDARLVALPNIKLVSTADLQYALACRYHDGCGVEKDEKEAFKLFKSAAQQGHVTAQNNLAIHYASGEGVERDAEKAFELFETAAKQGYAIAQCQLGHCYEFGFSVKKNIEIAIEWYKKAAEQGHTDAKDKLRDLLGKAISDYSSDSE